MDYTKRKHTIMLISAAALISLAFGAVAFIGNGVKNSPIYADDSPYAFTLGESLALAGNSSATALTTSGGHVSIAASALSVKSGDLGELAAGGYVMNSSAITGLKSVAIDFDEAGSVNALKVELGVSKGGSIDYSIATSSTLSADGTVTVSAQTTYDVAYVKISNAGSAASDVKSITLTYTCTKSVTDYQKITYMVEGATAKTEYLAKGASFASAYVPTLSGYSFNAWTDASGNAVTGTTINADMTVYPSWYNYVESNVSSTVAKDFRSFIASEMTTTATFGTFTDGGGSLTGLTASTTYTFTFPTINFAEAPGEVSFDLYGSWDEYKIAGFDIPYDNAHGSSDPYHVMIKYGCVFASSTSKGNYGELGALPSDVLNGTAGLVVTAKINTSTADVHFTKMVTHTYDYLTAYKTAVAALPASVTGSDSDFAAVDKVLHLRTCLTPYELTQNTVPSQVTAYQTSYGTTAKTIWTPSVTDGKSDMKSDGQWQEINGDYDLSIQLQDSTKKASNIFDYYISLPLIDYTHYASTSLIMKNALGKDYKIKVSSDSTTFISGAAGSTGFAWAYVNVDKKSDGYYLSVGSTDDAPSTYTSMKLSDDIVHGGAPVTLKFYMDVTNTAIAPGDIWKYAGMALTKISATLPF